MPAPDKPNVEVFTIDDMDAIEAELYGKRLARPRPFSALDLRNLGKLPTDPEAEPIDPLHELEAMRLVENRIRLRHNLPEIDKFTFWRDHVLFCDWGWGNDFARSVVRNYILEIWHRRVEQKLLERLISENDAAEARAAARLAPPEQPPEVASTAAIPPNNMPPEASDELVSDRTGAPGQPSSMHIVKLEFTRRVAERALVESALKDQAAALREWFVTKYPGLRPMTTATIENHIREDYWKARRSKPTE